MYKKHYPPFLSDNLWRLEKIRKDGPIDKKLESEGIRTVQDFLKLNTIDPNKLRSVRIHRRMMIFEYAYSCLAWVTNFDSFLYVLHQLVGMKDKQWSATLNHAKTCELGQKCYLFKTLECDITFNPIGEILAARIGDQAFPLEELHPQQRVR